MSCLFVICSAPGGSRVPLVLGLALPRGPLRPSGVQVSSEPAARRGGSAHRLCAGVPCLGWELVTDPEPLGPEVAFQSLPPAHSLRVKPGVHQQHPWPCCGSWAWRLPRPLQLSCLPSLQCLLESACAQGAETKMELLSAHFCPCSEGRTACLVPMERHREVSCPGPWQTVQGCSHWQQTPQSTGPRDAMCDVTLCPQPCVLVNHRKRAGNSVPTLSHVLGQPQCPHHPQAFTGRVSCCHGLWPAGLELASVSRIVSPGRKKGLRQELEAA